MRYQPGHSFFGVDCRSTSHFGELHDQELNTLMERPEMLVIWIPFRIPLGWRWGSGRIPPTNPVVYAIAAYGYNQPWPEAVSHLPKLQAPSERSPPSTWHTAAATLPPPCLRLPYPVDSTRIISGEVAVSSGDALWCPSDWHVSYVKTKPADQHEQWSIRYLRWLTITKHYSIMNCDLIVFHPSFTVAFKSPFGTVAAGSDPSLCISDTLYGPGH